VPNTLLQKRTKMQRKINVIQCKAIDEKFAKSCIRDEWQERGHPNRARESWVKCHPKVRHHHCDPRYADLRCSEVDLEAAARR